MTTAFLRKVSAVAVASALMLSFAASAATIYDNSVNDLTNRYSPGTLQVGDEIFVAGTERLLTGFSFEYYALVSGVGSGVFSGAPKVEIKFYLNEGPLFNGYKTPNSTEFYSSGWIPILAPTERSTLVFDQWADFGGGFYIPFGPGVSNFTWTVQFKDMGGSDTLGVDLYNPIVTGSQVGNGDYWEYVAGPGWTLNTNISGVPMNFAAKFEASIPEPSSTALAVLGGLGLLAVRWRIRKQ